MQERLGGYRHGGGTMATNDVIEYLQKNITDFNLTGTRIREVNNLRIYTDDVWGISHIYAELRLSTRPVKRIKRCVEDWREPIITCDESPAEEIVFRLDITGKGASKAKGYIEEEMRFNFPDPPLLPKKRKKSHVRSHKRSIGPGIWW